MSNTNIPVVFDPNGSPRASIPVVPINANYDLGSNITIPANSGTTPITGVNSGVYTLDVQFTGTSLKLQYLGADGTTWRDAVTMNASGTYAGDIRIGANATVRLYNPNGSAVTGVFGRLS